MPFYVKKNVFVFLQHVSIFYVDNINNGGGHGIFHGHFFLLNVKPLYLI